MSEKILTAEAVNEINNRLTVVTGFGDLIKQSLENGSFSPSFTKEKLELMVQAAFDVAKALS